MKRACQLAMRPSRTSRRSLDRSAWARRLAFNAARRWHLDERQAGRPVPGEYATATWLREWRKTESVVKPDLASVPARVFEYAAEDLERGWKSARSGRAGRPRFEKFDPLSGGFAVDGSIVVSDTHVKLPKIGEIRLMPGVRQKLTPGKYSYARVTKSHGEWFVSVVRDVSEPVRTVAGGIVPTIGLDPGVRKLATLSDGTTFQNPKALERVAEKAKKAKLSVARKRRAADKRLGVRKKGEHREISRRLRKAQRALARQMKRAAEIRKDAIRHVVSSIAKNHVVVAVEDTPVRNMTKRRTGKGRAAKAALNRSILSVAPGMLLQTLDQVLRDRRGGGVIRVRAAYTSQDCSECGSRTDCGSNETYTCAACGLVVDRDVNAANNILAKARVAVAGWSTAQKSAWEQGKTARLRQLDRAARAEIRVQVRGDTK